MFLQADWINSSANYQFETSLNDFPRQNRRLKTAVLGEWLQEARAQLNQFPEISVSSIYALIGFVLKKPVHFGLSHPEYFLSPSNERELYALFYRLLDGEPLPYLIEKQEFFGIDISLTPDVLIPRPETELLVEIALDWLKKKDGIIRIADVGIGSGCISVALGKHLPLASITGTDISNKALLVAKGNINKYLLGDRISLVQTNLLTGLAAQFDCICANLPYIPTTTLSTLPVRKYEPLAALDGGHEGLRYIEPFLYQAQRLISPDGLILMEIESTLSRQVENISSFVFPEASIKIVNDLAGLPRLIQIIIGVGR